MCKLILILFFSCIISKTSYAKLLIFSDILEVNKLTHRLIFNGNVIIRFNNVVASTTKVIVQLEDDGTKMSYIEIPNVIIAESLTKIIRAQYAYFDANASLLKFFNVHAEDIQTKNIAILKELSYITNSATMLNIK